MCAKRRSDTGAEELGLDRVFRSLGGFAGLLSSIAEAAEAEAETGEVSRTGEIGGNDKRIKAVYGFSVRVGGGGSQ